MRAGAIALAIAVVAWLAWRAQRDADRSAPAGGGTAAQGIDLSESTGDPANLVELPAVLPSSKFLVIKTDDQGETGAAVDPLLFSSKSGRPLPGHDQGAVFDDGAVQPAPLLQAPTPLLRSSKSTVITEPASPTRAASPKR
jgi:hypothetical protein